MSEDLQIYKIRKLIYELIFNSEKIDLKEAPYVFDLVVLKSIKNIVEYHTANGDLHPKIINNIGDFLVQARFFWEYPVPRPFPAAHRTRSRRRRQPPALPVPRE